MKFAWRQTISDNAAWNSGLVEEVDMDAYKDLLAGDAFEDELDGVDSDLVDA